LHDLEPKDAASMMALACKVSKRIVEEFGAIKTYVVAVGDKDPHFHVHILPKWETSDNLGPHIFAEKGWAKGEEVSLSDDDVAQLRNLLKTL
jgi:diadenosine tetraphosphate (Ap4A) HIT family hydrolase